MSIEAQRLTKDRLNVTKLQLATYASGVLPAFMTYATASALADRDLKAAAFISAGNMYFAALTYGVHKLDKWNQTRTESIWSYLHSKPTLEDTNQIPEQEILNIPYNDFSQPHQLYPNIEIDLETARISDPNSVIY